MSRAGSGLINTGHENSEVPWASQSLPPSFPSKQEEWVLGSDALAPRCPTRRQAQHCENAARARLLPHGSHRARAKLPVGAQIPKPMSWAKRKPQSKELRGRSSSQFEGTKWGGRCDTGKEQL